MNLLQTIHSSEQQRSPGTPITGCAMKKVLLTILWLFILMSYANDAYPQCMTMERNTYALDHLTQYTEPSFKKSFRWGFIEKVAMTAEKLKNGVAFKQKKERGMKCVLRLSIFEGELECKF